LPGNPVSTLICLVRYVIPAITAAMGAMPETVPMLALAQSVPGRKLTAFVPVTINNDEQGRVSVLPHTPSGSGDFLALAGTTGFVELPPRTEPFPAGYLARLYRW
jgi:molybdopterin molybdotransferase